MAEKKRGGSFRRIFPNIFFSNKSKEKTSNVDIERKNLNESSTSRSNKYHNPQCILERNEINHHQKTDGDSERIYENLSNVANNNESSSNFSSSSTLVSNNFRQHKYQTKHSVTASVDNCGYMARPQVPPKPQNEILYSSPNVGRNHINTKKTDYPDVYYHSLEKNVDQIPPIDEIETYRTPQVQANPASVGAEIKKVSTKFLISPKKEAEVRTIQPTRARSLSFDKNNPDKVEDNNLVNNNFIEKPYNYSAPTSPISAYHKIPTMPMTVSPYEHVRKAMIETEEKRNSISRSSSRNKSTPSPGLKTLTLEREKNKIEESIKKEKTRQQVEAFYWQKIKELKQQEDELLLRQTTMNTASSKVSYTNSARSTPNSLLIDSRAGSILPGDTSSSINSRIYTSSPFIRGKPERRTDTFLYSRSSYADSDVIYRHPEKLYSKLPHQRKSQPPNHPIGCATETRSVHQSQTMCQTGTLDTGAKLYDAYNLINVPPSMVSKCAKMAPQPPIRTTSVHLGKHYKIVNNKRIYLGNSLCSESESGSEAGEIQKIMQNIPLQEEDWQGDPRFDGGVSDGEGGRVPSRGRVSRRDDPRRHTLAGNHLYIHQHHPAHISTIDVEPPLPRYPQPTNTLLFDDDPGVMSEVETSSTGFRRGGKQRSSLPVVRTPSKTLERPLGLVFLQYRNETKRALLPNEITSIDTVKALFVRSFPKQLTMQYMDSPLVKIYIHDSSKDMFYELEDVRAHLRDIRDRSVLRLFESTDMGGGVFPGSVGAGSVSMPSSVSSSWDQDQSYFSEPEIDSDYHHQHVHKTKVKAPAYYMGTSAPNTLPRGATHLRAFSPAAPPVPADRKAPGGHSAPSKPLRSYIRGSGSERCFPFSAPECPRGTEHLYNLSVLSSDGYMSSPERAPRVIPYEDPYYSQFMGPAVGGPDDPSDSVIIDDAYQMYGVNAITTAPRPMPRPPYDTRLGPPVDDMQRLRVEKMERQLANLTGLVQKALQVPGTPAAPPVAPRQEFQPSAAARPAPQDAARPSSLERPPKLGRDRFQKSVSFEKSVSFSDDPPDMNSPKQHSPQHSADTKPTKPAIKSSTLPRTSSQERDRLKPAPPPKPAGLVGQQMLTQPQKSVNINVNSDFFNQLQILQNQSRDLRIETRNLRRSTLAHAIHMREMMADTIMKIGDLAARFCNSDPDSKLTREEEMYRQDMLLLENDLYELEGTVERLRGQAANRYRETRVNIADIERIAMILSKSSKTVADWKVRFPLLQNTMKAKLTAEMEKVARKEKMLEEEPERLELALRRCKKLTGTLVTLKRLACVQEQRLPPLNDGRVSPSSSLSSTTITPGPSSEEYHSSENACQGTAHNNKGSIVGRVVAGRGGGAADIRAENALDALLDELQTFSKPAAERGGRGDGLLRRLHSYPSGSDTDVSPPVQARGQHPPKPPVPERHPELLAMAARRPPPPPPPRTTSRSPLASPISPSSPPCPNSLDSNDDKSPSRQALLEQRHQELLKKQKALQEQYARLQMIQRSGSSLPMNAQPDLKKTGSESNLLTRMNLNLATATLSGSMSNIAAECESSKIDMPTKLGQLPTLASDTVSTTSKVYETDIL